MTLDGIHDYPEINTRALSLDFDDVQLPALTETEEAIRRISFDLDKFIMDAEDAELGLDHLQGSFALRKIDEFVGEYVCEAFRSQVSSANSEVATHLEAAVKRKEWTGVQEGSGEKFVLRELIAKANRLKFALIRNWIELNDDTGLTPVAELEYEYVTDAMAAIDQLFIKMVLNPPVVSSDRRKELGLTNECAITREENGEIVEVPYGEAFPFETQEIINQYRGLITALNKVRLIDEITPSLLQLTNRKIKYYTAVMRAFSTDNIEDWREADVLLAGQIRNGNDVMHFHPIETGYGEDRILRLPEIGLRAPDLAEGNAQRIAEETKVRMLGSLKELAKNVPAVEASLHLVEKSNAQLRHFLGSGMEMDLKPAGQILPNEAESRERGGIDSSLDMDSAISRYPLQVRAFCNVFGEDIFDSVVKGRKDFDEAMGGGTASHELGHAVGLVEGVRERLGESTLMGPFIEEWKATVAGIVANYLLPYYKGERTYEDIEDVLVGQIVMACRYASMRNHPSAANYFRHSMLLMKPAEELGIVEEVDGAWQINLDEGKVTTYFANLLDQFKKVMGIYYSGQEDDLRAYLAQELHATPFMNAASERNPVPDAEKNSPAMLAVLPPKADNRVHKGLTETAEAVESILAPEVLDS